MRPADYDDFKATMDGFHETSTTALAERSWSQSSAVYGSPDRVRQEQERLFDRLPLVAACSSELAEPNAYVARSLVGTPVLVVRQPDGSARAFLNSCRHRGSRRRRRSCGPRTAGR